MKRLATTILFLALALPAMAVTTGTELWIPAAFRGNGAEGSVWSTDVFIYNPQSVSASVTVTLLSRDSDSTNGPSFNFTVAPDETLVLADIIGDTFALNTAAGAFLVQSNTLVAVDARLINQAGDATFGQGFEGVPSELALVAGSRSSHRAAAIGGASDAAFRSNFYGVNTTEGTTQVRVALLDSAGAEIGSKTYSMAPRSAILKNVIDISNAQTSELTVVFEVLSGAGIFGLSTVDSVTGDPTTHGMAATLPAGSIDLNSSAWVVGQADFNYGGLTMLQIEGGAITRIVANHALFDNDGGTLAGCGIAMRWKLPATGSELPIASDGSFSATIPGRFGEDDLRTFDLEISGQISGGVVNGTWRYVDLSWGSSEADLCTGTSPEVSFFGILSAADICSESAVDEWACTDDQAKLRSAPALGSLR